MVNILEPASWRQFTSIKCILLPVTDNFLFLNQWMREIVPRMNVPDLRVDLRTTAYEVDTLSIEPCCCTKKQ